MAPLKPMTPPYSTSPFVKITEPGTSGFQIPATESVEFRVAICGNCGYAEHYIEDIARLWKYWQKGYR